MAKAARRKNTRSACVSSGDQKGLNEDGLVVQPGETALLADLEGSGSITHLWFVQACCWIAGPGLIPHSKYGVAVMEIPNTLGLHNEISEPDYYREVIIRMYWDDSKTPNFIAPIGDFFCLEHSMAANLQSMPFTVLVKPSEEKEFSGAAAFHEDTLYFHAHWHRENPANGWAPQRLQTNSLETQVTSLDGKDNYVILQIEGAGQYIGCNHSIVNFQDTFWGEGGDMIFIDDDTWPPSMHGTGEEDYFGQGWGMQKNAYPFCGTVIYKERCA